MKAIAYNEFGTTAVLKAVEQPKPTIKADEVLIRVKAFSINPMDWKIRKGEMKLMSGSNFPRLTGTDFAGIIEETGTSVSGLKKGDEVFGVVKNMKVGASAEYVAVTATLVWKKPSSISFVQAASLPVAGVAAVTSIQKMGRIDSQTTILVNGATGGFGMFLLQLLRQQGANVTAVSSPKGLAYAKGWGANTVIDYTKENVLTKKVTYDIVVDLSGKMGYENAKQIMNAKAIFLNPTPKTVEIPFSFFANLFTSKKHIVILSSPSTKYAGVLQNAIEHGLHIEVNKTFPFDQYRAAYDYAEQGGYIGKVVVEFN